MKSKIYILMAMLALAAIACSLSFNANAADTVEPFVPETPTVEASQESGNRILFEDDFSALDSGWDQTTFPEGLTDYERGVYRIFVSAENWSAWANPSRNFKDVSISVVATKVGGDDDNEFGLICRHSNIDNFYVATISSDGYYGFLSRKDGESLELLNMENMLTTSAINQGEASNTIRLDCVGSTMTLYINGEFVDETTDSTISSGDVGLYAGTFSVPGTDILFDDFVVRAP
jgi:hypothetical protein